MTNLKSLTPEERAEKIVFSIFHEPKMDTPGYESLVVTEIRAAVDTDRSSRTADDLYKHSYKCGKQDAYEFAAKLMRSNCKAKECENKCWHEHMIRDRAKTN